MGLFSLFRRQKKRKPRSDHPPATTAAKNKHHLDQLDGQVDQIRSEIHTINLLLQRHDQQITEWSTTCESNTQSLRDLEARIGPSNQPVAQPVAGPIESPALPWTPRIEAPGLSSQGLHVSRFSHQEQRLLAVFFQHPNMALSYVDLARFLGKSPHTVKNQVHQIRTKADVLDKAVDPENRNRFRLKEGIKIEKYLNVGDSLPSGPAMDSPTWPGDR